MLGVGVLFGIFHPSHAPLVGVSLDFLSLFFLVAESLRNRWENKRLGLEDSKVVAYKAGFALAADCQQDQCMGEEFQSVYFVGFRE